MLDFVGLSDRAQVFGRGLDTFEQCLTDVAKCMVGAPKLVTLIKHDVDLFVATCVRPLVLDFGRRTALGLSGQVLSDQKIKAAYLGAGQV